ncbi:hypothetical protein A7P85_02565 [Eikenella corrodens]|uniref:Uncharacterized protein n=1 Tax=Eikenella corrodens TaxID=539 RepID=A0A1A9RGY0_EIKCO|nr:hypothetical protein A7P85_02565 [Eikenella corrodens]OAM23910.1 hypothetical protein A7P92_05430 [Eikenella corrodens]
MCEQWLEAVLGSLQSILGIFIVLNLPTLISQTPHALYRAMFFYIVAAFGIGWFLPVNGVLWGILLATALVLYLQIRSLARGEKRLYDRFPAGKSGISSLQWLYLMIAVTGMVIAFYGGTAASYGELREARGIVPAKPYNARTECYARQEALSQNEFVQFLLSRHCRHVSGTNYLPFPNGGETLHLNCAANLHDACELAYAHAGKTAMVKYSGSRLYEMEVDGVPIYRYAEQADRFNRERKSALLDALIAVPLFALPLMWFHRRFDDWQNELAEGETVPDETPMWWKYTVLCCWYLPLAAAFTCAGIGWWRNIDEPIALTIGLLFIGALLFFTLRGAYRVFHPKQPAS